jgi:hypothetical protein
VRFEIGHLPDLSLYPGNIVNTRAGARHPRIATVGTMTSFADRNRERIIQQFEADPRIGKEKVVSVAPLIRGSFVMLVFAGVIGAVLAQIILGNGGAQFGLGLLVGYAAYAGYKLWTMNQPKIIGAMAVLTRKRLLLVGSRRVGVAAEWPLKELEDIEVKRRGNLLVMGKIIVKPIGKDGVTFFLSNRSMGNHLIDAFNEMRGK